MSTKYGWMWSYGNGYSRSGSGWASREEAIRQRGGYAGIPVRVRMCRCRFLCSCGANEREERAIDRAWSKLRAKTKPKCEHSTSGPPQCWHCWKAVASTREYRALRRLTTPKTKPPKIKPPTAGEDFVRRMRGIPLTRETLLALRLNQSREDVRRVARNIDRLVRRIYRKGFKTGLEAKRVFSQTKETKR